MDEITGIELPELVKYACELSESDNVGIENKNQYTNHEAIIERSRTTITPDDDYNKVIGGYNEVILTTIAKSFARKIQRKKQRSMNFFPRAKFNGLNGFLLYGLPGTGKTTMLKTVAVRIAKQLKTNISFINVNSADLMDKYVGESQKLIDALYRVADKMSPTLICVDEIDGFCGKRKDNEEQHVRSFKTQFLASMCGMVPHPYVITAAATNVPWDLDYALLRRFEMKYYIELPNPDERIEIMQNIISAATSRQFNEHPDLALTSSEIVTLTEGFTGSDLETAIITAVDKVTFITYDGSTLSDREYNLRKHEIEQGDIPISATVGFLNTEALIHGIKSVKPHYDVDELEKLNEFARDNSHNFEHDDTNYSSQPCNPDLLGFLCCCIRC